MRRRASLLRREAAGKRERPAEPSTVRQEEAELDEPPSDRARPDPVERFAQDGFGALERFGAELEALFMGPPPRRATPNATAETPSGPPLSTAPSAAVAGSLHEVEAELNRLLMEHGIVVRGHDIARVVSLMTGKSVAWAE
jgi:hypothetical protein